MDRHRGILLDCRWRGHQPTETQIEAAASGQLLRNRISLTIRFRAQTPVNVNNPNRWSILTMRITRRFSKHGMLRTVSPLFFLPFAIVAAAQTASDFATRYGDPDVERFLIRPRITLMVAYGPDRTGCQMIVQPKRPILKNDNESELMAREMVPEMLDELLPESAKESLLTNIEQVIGCDVQVLTTLYNVTINASHERACHTSEGGVANVLIVRKNEHCSAAPKRSDSSSDVSVPQTAIDLHTRYGAPDAQRYVVRPGITLMVTYGMDEFACQMVVEPTTSIIHQDEPAKYLRPEVVTEVLEEVLPEAERGALILRTVTKSGCNDYETIDYQNVTVSRFRHNCHPPNPEIEGAATVTRKNLCSNGGK